MRLASCAIVLALLPALASAQAPERKSRVDDAGTLHLPNGVTVPYSDLASSEARRNYIDDIRGFESLADKPADWKIRPGETEIQQMRRWLDAKVMIPWLDKLRETFAVDIRAERIAGVQTDIVTPREGIAPENRDRVLINLHGGGMKVGARYGGQLESVPIASLGRIKVITVDYRMAPEYRYPAAEEDVVTVYRALRKRYRAENIGIYGCSAGASLAGNAVARILAEGLPAPGAIGMFGYGPFGGERAGDSLHIFSGKQPAAPEKAAEQTDGYLAGVDLQDRKRYPVEDPAMQRRFPPSLLISGTRDLGLSRTVFAHARLVELGVKADLHVWEGAQHCSFAQPFVDPRVPETRQAWKVINRFFATHLGSKPR